MKPVLNVKNVSFSFKADEVLSDVSFSMDKGDFVGLIGPNGSGKTTLLRLILGLYPLQKGTITILGKDTTSFASWEKVGYVPQKAANLEEQFPATVKEVVLTGLLSGKRFPRRYTAEDRDHVIHSLNTVGMGRFIERKIGELSGGQQQRVLIARAMITSPELLILDEPTSGIDQAAMQAFYDLIGNLNKSGLTILLVSHDLGRITHHVNKVASLNRTLDFYGSHEEFCRHPAGDTDHHCLKLRRG